MMLLAALLSHELVYALTHTRTSYAHIGRLRVEVEICQAKMMMSQSSQQLMLPYTDTQRRWTGAEDEHARNFCNLISGAACTNLLNLLILFVHCKQSALCGTNTPHTHRIRHTHAYSTQYPHQNEKNKYRPTVAASKHERRSPHYTQYTLVFSSAQNMHNNIT